MTKDEKRIIELRGILQRANDEYYRPGMVEEDLRTPIDLNHPYHKEKEAYKAGVIAGLKEWADLRDEFVLDPVSKNLTSYAKILKLIDQAIEGLNEEFEFREKDGWK